MRFPKPPYFDPSSIGGGLPWRFIGRFRRFFHPHPAPVIEHIMVSHPSPESITESLPVLDPPALARARRQVAQRPLDYPIGNASANDVALAARLKPLLRQVLPPASLERERARYEARGYIVGVTEPEANYWTGKVGQPDLRAIIVGRDRDRVQEMLESERTIAATVVRTDDREQREHLLEQTTARQGYLLGYPQCCVENFVAATRQQHPGLLDGVHAALDQTCGPLYPRLNMLDYHVFRYLPWTPCRFDCASSLTYVNAIAKHLGGHFPDFVQNLDKALSAHRLFFHRDVQLSLQGQWNGQVLQIEQVWPTACDRHPSSTLSAAAGEAVARLLALFQPGKTLSVAEEKLFLNDRPLLRCDGLRLFAFGETADSGDPPG